MDYKFSEEINNMLRELEATIIEEYDSSSEVGVRVNLMNKSHNTMSEYEKILDNSDVIQKMHEKLEELEVELEGSKARLEIAKLDDNGRDIAEEEKICARLEALISKLEEKIEKTKPTKSKVIINRQNAHEDPRFVAIHETTPGITKKYEQGIFTEDVVRPTKPGRYVRGFDYYDKLIRNQGITDRESAIARCDEIEAEFAQDRPFGRTIGYHARIDTSGLLGRDEIVILLPATASPDQVSNKAVTPYVYGIERCVGEEQDFHKGIATQAMLTAFLFKQLGYDEKMVQKRVFPHNFFARLKNSCPNRMLYASILLQQSKKRELTEQELEDIKEYVPWEVFMNLVMTFFERDKYPQELRKKFIYDMNDYDAYMANPQEYDYETRKKDRHISKAWVGQEEGHNVPMNVTEDLVKAKLEEEKEDR